MSYIRNLLGQLKEAFISIIPITVIILVIFGLQYTPIFPDTSISTNQLWIFLACIIFVAIGIALFTIGSETSMSKVGTYVGTSITKKKSVTLIVIVAFLLGLFITLAEPDLEALGAQVSSSGDINVWVFKIVVAVGVGIFMTIGLLRIIFQKSLKLWLLFSYFIIFALACLFGSNGETIFEISFDASGVTAGPLTTPFILTFGAGIATVRGGKDSSTDSFGIAGFCSIGPTILLMIMFLPLQSSGILETLKGGSDYSNIIFSEVVVDAITDCALSIAPIIIFFVIYDLLFLRLKRKEMLRIFIGFIITYLGITVFLAAANMGLIPIGYSLGLNIMDGGVEYGYLLVIIALVVGICIVLVEPSISILGNQVEEVSSRAIKKRDILIALAAGVAIAIVLSVVRVVYGNNFSILYYLVPIFILCLGLALFVPDIYVAIGFDSGGVATGPMSSCFVMPFIIGIYSSVNTADGSGFGVLGLIQIMPTLMIEILGLISVIKEKRLVAVARKSLLKEENDAQVIHF